MKKTILLLLICFAFKFSFAQLEKGNWLVGGSGSFSSAKYMGIPVDFTQTNIDISTTLGYFILNKFVTGVSGGYSYVKADYYGHPNYINSSYNTYNIGPFLRYYFLPIQQRANVFAQTEYNLGFSDDKLYRKALSFKAGPVLYINNNIGIEFNLGYSIIQNEDSVRKIYAFQTGIGFQIHLKK
ncbi:hypothetical protein PBAC_13590 [Pedobacter glucosidilyticus]|nr:outer membrane beta-barrel protein [Pedobacter glucosidilyticus]KHJ38353.1 hypothetical protein PBAC_13590 [Pedobacter glucosidilyticus]